MALQGKNRGVLAFPATGLEQAIKELENSCGIHQNEEIKKLITKMIHIIAVLKDAEKKQISSEADRLLLWELKEEVFDAEDLIDELATDAAVQSMGAHTYNFPNLTARMMGQIRAMNDRLVSLESQIAVLGYQLSTIQDSYPGLPTWRQTSSLLLDETSVIGRDREREHIIEMLTQLDGSSSYNRGFSIVPIVGLGGMGKTALAQLVYNDEKVKKHFELMMWVCVSNSFDLVRLTKNIIEAALAFRGKHKQCQVTNWDLVQRRLLQEVEGKTFLLVLDDVWEAAQSMWEELFKPLHSGKKGSKVLVTARNRAFVDKLEGRMEISTHLRGLSDVDIWDLCKRYAFRSNNSADDLTSAEYSDLEDIGRDIVQKFKGSPLAARTIGSLLNHELTIQHWKTVLESEFWTLEQVKENILLALQLSYQYLPPDRKQCFVYCSLFPKDYRLSRERVVQLWEAQSFINKDRGTIMETMGSKYFDEFVHMSFFEPKPHWVIKDAFVMHDLIYYLVEYVSSDDCFRLEDQKLVEIPDTVRHMSVYASERCQIDIINKLCFYKKLRTLLFVPENDFDFDTNDLDQLFLKLKMLRALELSCCGIRELPGSIGDLKHLRYIDLQGNHGLTRLPESLGNLYNLQVLNLNNCGIRELPGSIGDLKHLRYIDLDGNRNLENLPESLGNLYSLQVLYLNYCRSLCVLPTTMSQLVNLKHLRTDNYKLVSRIDGLGKMTGLQELQVRGRQVRELGGMCRLRQLTAYKLEEVGSKEEALLARLPTMECLQVLKLYWSRNSDTTIPELEEEVLQALQPNKGIRELHIKGYGGIILNCFYSSLKTLYVSRCPSIQSLPDTLNCISSLETLHISKCPSLRSLPDTLSHLSFLRTLDISECPSLQSLPETLNHLSSLRTLTIWRCRSIQLWPNRVLPSSLKTLQIYKCYSLALRHIYRPKSMWPELAHIPNVIINGHRLQ